MADYERRPGGRWRARIRRKGYPERSSTFGSKAEAQAWARSIEQQIDRGVLLDTREASQTTLGEALRRYLREITPGKKGWKPETVRIRQWLTDPLAMRPLIQIRGTDLAAYRDKRAADGMGPNSIRLELAIISHLYTVARTEWRMEGLTNPVEAIRKPKAPKARTRRLLQGEEATLLSRAGTPLRQALILALETAMRRGELAALRRDQIDRKRRVAALLDTKNGDAREVPLSTAALAAIDDLPARLDGWLFGPPEQFADWLSHAFIDLCAAAGIVGLHLHDLRREAISRLFEKGWTAEEVRAVSGHRTMQMLAVYSRLRAEDLARKLG